MYVRIKSIWDLLSATILLCNYIIIYDSFTGNIHLPLGVILTLTFEKIGKLITGTWYPPVFARPDNACDCSIFNDGGPVGGRPGFPSGHVAMASYFAYIMVFTYFENNYLNLSIATLYPFIMGIARYFKYCHNIYQIIAGWILGFLVAYFIKNITCYKIKKN
uniref:Phosphatidic acid phosphatase type 2/haloperoxidase domain-containing protein n=1 Tax=viral metagenome TaxID=1070528 RepID=A0A6C0BS88_9ZZZZ